MRAYSLNLFFYEENIPNVEIETPAGRTSLAALQITTRHCAFPIGPRVGLHQPIELCFFAGPERNQEF